MGWRGRAWRRAALRSARRTPGQPVHSEMPDAVRAIQVKRIGAAFQAATSETPGRWVRTKPKHRTQVPGDRRIEDEARLARIEGWRVGPVRMQIAVAELRRGLDPVQQVEVEVVAAGASVHASAEAPRPGRLTGSVSRQRRSRCIGPALIAVSGQEYESSWPGRPRA